MTFGDKNLSAKNIITSTNDGIVWAQASENDNQDLAIKKILHNEVDFIRNILESEGAKISTNSLLYRLAPDD
jgi:hypothetical protein